MILSGGSVEVDGKSQDVAHKIKYLQANKPDAKQARVGCAYYEVDDYDRFYDFYGFSGNPETIAGEECEILEFENENIDVLGYLIGPEYEELNTPQLTKYELNKVELRVAIEKDYFYVPIISCTDYDAQGNRLELPLLVEDNSATCDLSIAYASKVSAGTTPEQAVAHDLEKDFGYTKGFTIDQVDYYNEAENRQGETLTRVYIKIRLDEKFDVQNVHPLGLNLVWSKVKNKF